MDPRKHENEWEFAYGSGLLDPVRAVDPGLVFDASAKDYMDFLCKQGYNTTTLRLVSGDHSACRNSTTPGRGWNLNYPSFSLAIEDGQKINGIFTRTVTNVGSPNSTYFAGVQVPESLFVTVKPSVLRFSALGEKKSFIAKVKGGQMSQVPIISGSITWIHGVTLFHIVRTPLVVYTVLPSTFSNNSSRPTTKSAAAKAAASHEYPKGGQGMLWGP